MRERCGIYDPTNRCRCERIVGAALETGRLVPGELLFATHPSRGPAKPVVDEVEALARAAEVIRSHPEYAAPGALSERLRELLRSDRLALLRD
jgi:hypothetical protein